MNAKITVTCYRSKILSNGEAPLMVKITKNGKRSLKTLGISLKPKYWDFEHDKPKSNCPNRTYIVSIITNALQKYQAIQLDMEAKNEDYTASEILADTASKTELITVEDFLTSQIQQLRDNGKVGNIYAYLNLRTTLHNFYGKKLNFLFNAVDLSFCNKFEAWMRKNRFEDTTMHYYFRTLRATYNKAIEVKCADREKSPFIEYKLSRFSTKTKKRAEDPYETIEEYKLRVNEETAKKKQEELQTIVMDEYVQRFAKQMSVHDMRIKPYDAENQSFLIECPYGDIVLSVPRSNNEARDFAENWNSVRVYNQNFVISNRKLALAGLTFSTPTGKIYTYNNQKALAYNEIKVDANFTEIDYSMLANSKGSENKAKIGKKEVVVGVSDVDVNIPKGKGNNEKTFAIIIANEDYTSVPTVPLAGNDGRVFAQYCEKTLGLPKENILQYPNATYGKMIRAMQDITNIASAYDDIRVIFYYAEHGIPNESTRDAFLLPIDADGSQTEVCYPLKKLYGELSDLGAKQVVVFLDACFSGSTGEGGTLMANARSVALVARQERPTGNMIVFSAASDDQTAFPYKDQGHGMFTYYLLKKLQSSKGNVTLGDLGQYIIDNVKQKSVVLNRKLQTPTVTCSSDLTGDWKSIKLNK